MKTGYTYIMSNYQKTVLYVGVTSDIENRVLEHKLGIGSKFSTMYKTKYLMHFESFLEITSAIEREKQLKRWHKNWKWNLIKENNPELHDLAADWYDEVEIKRIRASLDSETSSE